MDRPNRDVTVVVPLFNKGGEVARAVHSVLTQRGGAPVVVVVDNGSTDGGDGVVEAMGAPEVRLVREAKRGVAAARNRGMAEAATPLIGFLDADDEWKPAFLETVMALRLACPQAGAWATAYEEINPRGERVALSFHGVPTEPAGGLIPDLCEAMLRFPPISSSSVVVRAEALARVGGFPEGEALGEDWDTWVRLALRFPIAFAPRVEAVYHREASNRAVERLRFDERESALARTLLGAIRGGGTPTAPVRSLRRLLVKHRCEVAKHLLEVGRRREARRVLSLAVRQRVLLARCLRWWFKTWV